MYLGAFQSFKICRYWIPIQFSNTKIRFTGPDSTFELRQAMQGREFYSCYKNIKSFRAMGYLDKFEKSYLNVHVVKKGTLRWLKADRDLSYDE